MTRRVEAATISEASRRAAQVFARRFGEFHDPLRTLDPSVLSSVDRLLLDGHIPEYRIPAYLSGIMKGATANFSGKVEACWGSVAIYPNDPEQPDLLIVDTTDIRRPRGDFTLVHWGRATAIRYKDTDGVNRTGSSNHQFFMWLSKQREQGRQTVVFRNPYLEAALLRGR